MLTLGIETIVVLLLIMGVVSAFGGYVFAQERQRRAGGGKSAAELRTELGEYKETVNEHFQTTAGLLHDMTEQYRAVYEHMAAGAQNLCDPETAQTQIESLRAGLLPSASADAAGAVSEGDVDHAGAESGDDDAADTEVAEPEVADTGAIESELPAAATQEQAAAEDAAGETATATDDIASPAEPEEREEPVNEAADTPAPEEDAESAAPDAAGEEEKR